MSAKFGMLSVIRHKFSFRFVPCCHETVDVAGLTSCRVRMAQSLNLPLDSSISTPADIIVSELASRIAGQPDKEKFLDFATQFV